jgi:2-methylisocitrate lyase-like PEP mutase family enzyme
MALKGVELSVAELAAMGVKRISVGSALARSALSALLRGAREMKEYGTFRFADDAEPFRTINSLFTSDDRN